MSRAENQISPRFADSRRSGTGLAITIAVHAAIAAVALIGLHIATEPAPSPPAPITTRHIPTPVITPPLPTPRIVERPVAIDVPEPVVTTAAPAPTTFIDPVLPLPGPIAAGLDPSPIDTIPDIRPAGPTTAARFDPRFAGSTQPPYPAAARRLGEEGSVVVHIRIGRDGRVLAATLAQSSGSPRLDAAALAHALAKWRFTPAVKDGTPIEASRDITVRFRLDQAS